MRQRLFNDDGTITNLGHQIDSKIQEAVATVLAPFLEYCDVRDLNMVVLEAVHQLGLEHVIEVRNQQLQNDGDALGFGNATTSETEIVPEHNITLNFDHDCVEIAQHGVWVGQGIPGRCSDGSWVVDVSVASPRWAGQSATNKALDEHVAKVWHTHPAPAILNAENGALLSLVNDRWVIHPADYLPWKITDEDIAQDEALRALTVDEVF